MANLDTEFNANDVEPIGTYEPIPAGTYKMQVIHSDWTPTKDGRSEYMMLEMEVMDGVQAGRKYFERLNLRHPNIKTSEIAHRVLSAICHAAGVLHVRDTASLHFKPFMASISVQPRSDKPDQFENKIKYLPPEKVAQASPGQAPVNSPTTPAAAAQQVQSSKAPWQMHRR